MTPTAKTKGLTPDRLAALRAAAAGDLVLYPSSPKRVATAYIDGRDAVADVPVTRECNWLLENELVEISPQDVPAGYGYRTARLNDKGRAALPA